MPAAFVTGASGQDGGYLVERLLADGWEVSALVRDEDASLPASVRPFQGDLRDPAGLGRVVAEARPDTVFHLAGISSVAQSWQEPVLTAEVTGTAVAALLEASLALQDSAGREVRFVQASSSEIFGAATENPQTESTPIRPVSPYGAAKAFAHLLVGVYRGRGLHASSAILYNHESPRRPRASSPGRSRPVSPRSPPGRRPSSRSATSTPAATGAGRPTTSTRSSAPRAPRRPATTSSRPASRTPSASSLAPPSRPPASTSGRTGS